MRYILTIEPTAKPVSAGLRLMRLLNVILPALGFRVVNLAEVEGDELEETAH